MPSSLPSSTTTRTLTPPEHKASGSRGTYSILKKNISTCLSSGSTRAPLVPPPRGRWSIDLALSPPRIRVPLQAGAPHLSSTTSPRATSPSPSSRATSNPLLRSLVPCRKVIMAKPEEVPRTTTSRVEGLPCGKKCSLATSRRLASPPQHLLRLRRLSPQRRLRMRGLGPSSLTSTLLFRCLSPLLPHPYAGLLQAFIPSSPFSLPPFFSTSS